MCKKAMVANVPFLLRFHRSWSGKAAERFGLFLLAVLYCFALIHVDHIATDSPLHGEHHTAQGFTISDASGLSLCPTTSTERLVNSLSAPPSSGFKDLSKGFAAAIRASDRAERSAFAVHSAPSRSLVLALWRAVILFPFHVFW